MRFQKKLRGMQDRLRNAGWRIQWIPWQLPDTPEFICSPIGLLGAAIFVGTIVVFLFVGHRSDSSRTISVNVMIVTAAAGLIIALIGILYSALKKQAGWTRIDATCLGREIREVAGDPDDIKPVWAYRLVCRFIYNEKTYTVTPEYSHAINFRSAQHVEQYLNERIQPDGRCHLWINPHNPLQTIFHKKRWWL